MILAAVNWWIAAPVGALVLAFVAMGARCRSVHPVHGRCVRAPHHFPHLHAGARGGTWR